MKQHKLIVATLLICAGTLCLPTTVQGQVPDEAVSIFPVSKEQHGDMLHIDIDIAVDRIKLKTAQGIDLTPQIVAPGKTYSLPMVSLKGRNEFLAYERKMALMSAREKAIYQHPYMVVKAYKLKHDTIHYRYAVPFEPWMADAELYVQRDNCGCGIVELMDLVQLGPITPELQPDPTPYVPTPYLAYVQPQVEAVKQREVQAECFLDFVVNKTDIRPDYMNNPRELAKIRAMIDELKNDRNIEVKQLDIIGYASPEGTLASNKRLSEGRAMALRNYLASRYNFPLNAYRIVFGGENWDGLVQVLNTMDVAYKDEVLDIINYVPIEAGRESQVMKLRGGEPYRFMLRHIFPSLRVAICKVQYNVKSFDQAEAIEAFKKNPKNLSLYEMFMVASQYTKGSDEFIAVFETAAQLFPEDPTANLNAAAAAISRNELDKAERHLNKVHTGKESPVYKNTAGMLYLLKGAYEQAETLLQSAADSGLEAAKQNMEELKKCTKQK